MKSSKTIDSRNRTARTEAQILARRERVARDEAQSRANLLEARLRATRELSSTNEALYQLLAKHIGEAVTLINADDSIAYASPSCEQVIGVQPGKNFKLSSILHPDDRHAVRLAFEHAVAKGRADSGPYRIIVPETKQLRWLQSSAMSIQANDPNVPRLIAVTRDITEDHIKTLAWQAELAQDRLVLGATSDSIAIVDRELNFVYRNPAFERLFPDATQGQDLLSAVDAEFKAPLSKAFVELRAGAGQSLNVRLRTDSASRLWLQLTGTPILDENTNAKLVMLVATDISKLVGAQDIIAQREQLFRELLETIPDAITLFDLDGNAIYDNPAVEKLFGEPRPLGRKYSYKMTGEAAKSAAALFSQVRRTGEAAVLEYTNLRLDGSPVFIKGTVTLQHDIDGQPSGFLVVRNDVTSLTTALQELQKNESQFRVLVEHNSDFITLFDHNQAIVYRNPALLAFLGDAREKAGSAPLTIHPEDLDRVRNSLRALYAGESDSADGEFRLISPRTGKTHWVASTARLVSQSEGSPQLVLSISRDITKEKEAQQRENRSNLLFRALVENNPGFVQIFNATTLEPVYDSPSLIRAAGPAYQKTGMKFGTFIHPDDLSIAHDAIERCTASGESQRATVRLSFKHGEEIWVEMSMQPLKNDLSQDNRLLVVSHDVTQLKRSEEARRQTQKLEAIGQLTGGLAHDFNNLLGIVIGNLDTLQEHLPKDPKLHKHAKAALAAAERGAEVTRSLLSVARRTPMRPVQSDVIALISEMLPLLRASAGAEISLTALLGKEPIFALIDPSGFNNAILNLVINARDALGNDTQLGQIVVSAGRGHVQQNNSLGLVPGDYALVEVTDNGPGMPAHVLSQAFDPFFTTKERGRGTGLGLPTILGMAEQLGGTATINSVEGEGTKVALYLPMPRAKEATTEGNDVAQKIALVVDEAQDLSEVTCQWLEAVGFKTEKAGDAASAIALLGSNAFDLMILPGSLPDSEGAQALVLEAVARCPDAKLVLTGPISESLPDQLSVVRWTTLATPFRKNELIDSINNLQHA